MQLLTQNDIVQLKSRFNDPLFAEVITKLKAVATDEMEHPLNIPTEGAGWTHNYTCPTHATRLIFDRAKPHEHVCGVDGEVFSGGLYDEAWRGFRNNNLVQSAYAAAIIWCLSGEEEFRQHTVDILRTYAQHYPDYAVHGINAGQGRLMGQSLDEAVWVIPAAWAFDLVAESLTDAEAHYIRENLFRGIGDHLITQLWTRIHNIQCWHLAGLATVGVLLDDEQYLKPAFDKEWGIEAQIADGVMEDGWWWEGSPHYHFYTLRALTSFAIAIRYQHPEFLENTRFKKMFTAPLDLLRADFSLPAFNDGWYDNTRAGGIGDYISVYERAYNFWQDPAYLQLLSNIYANHKKRTEADALLFGPDEIPPAQPPQFKSLDQSSSGYAVMNSTDSQRQLILKYGPHGGGHGHPDKLALVLWAYGNRISPDLGTPGYGIPMNNSWYRHTLSHNTVLLDGMPQVPATGTLDRFDVKDDVTLVEAHVNFSDTDDAIWEGVNLRRVILWKDDYFIDVVIVDCPQTRQIDLAWHHTGTLAFEGEAKPETAFTQTGYAHLKNIQICKSVAWQASWKNPNTSIWARNPEGTTTYITDAPGNPTNEEMSLILRRITAQNAVFVSVIEPFQDQGVIKQVEWENQDSMLKLSIQGHNLSDNWQLDYHSGTYEIL